MATSLEKTREFVDQLLDASDEDLRKFMPGLPVFMIRGLLPYLPRQLPDTAEELDKLLETAARFANHLKSDEQPVAELDA